MSSHEPLGEKGEREGKILLIIISCDPDPDEHFLIEQSGEGTALGPERHGSESQHWK